MRLLIALGGNALKGEDFRSYLKSIKKVCSKIATISKGKRILITHGNGPQVGDRIIQQEVAATKIKLPLDVCVAETQGEIGYLLQRELANEFEKNKIKRPIVTFLTRVLVDRNDPAFKKPTKPIGPFYSEVPKKFEYIKIGEKYRRVVPSPKPLKILEVEEIRQLFESGVMVIAGGGGGIPIIERRGLIKKKREFIGVEAVIDKDLTAAMLAKSISADMMLVLTNVDGVYLNYGKLGSKKLSRITSEEARAYMKAGHFPPGSMGPKIAAALEFLASGGKRVVIAHIKDAVKASEGKAGTIIEGQKRIFR